MNNENKSKLDLTFSVIGGTMFLVGCVMFMVTNEKLNGIALAGAGATIYILRGDDNGSKIS